MLRIAHRMDKIRISRVCFHGKNNVVSRFKNKSYWMTIVMPTMTPMRTPRRQDANTKSKAS